MMVAPAVVLDPAFDQVATSSINTNLRLSFSSSSNSHILSSFFSKGMMEMANLQGLV